MSFKIWKCKDSKGMTDGYREIIKLGPPIHALYLTLISFTDVIMLSSECFSSLESSHWREKQMQWYFHVLKILLESSKFKGKNGLLKQLLK